MSFLSSVMIMALIVSISSRGRPNRHQHAKGHTERCQGTLGAVPARGREGLYQAVRCFRSGEALSGERGERRVIRIPKLVLRAAYEEELKRARRREGRVD